MKVAVNSATPGVRKPRAQEMFEQSALAHPDAVAIVHGSTEFSYAELNSRANRLARLLRTLGAGPETVIGVCLARSPEFVVAELAVLKAGAAFLPLDAEYPAERLDMMVRDAAAIVIHRGQPPGGSVTYVNLDVASDLITKHRDHDLAIEVLDQSLAYVIYTSGSTGRPKAVQVQHAQLAAVLAAVPDLLGLDEGSRCVQPTSFAFDMSVGVTFATLGSGGTLILADPADAARPDRLARLAREQSADVLVLPPSVLAPLPDEALAGLSTVCVGGEACSVSLARRFRRGRRFVNAYGPTETTIVATSHVSRASGAEHDAVPIGAELPGVHVYVVDTAGDRAPAGEVGEICVGGAGVARGYLGSPAATAERFVPDPWSGAPGARMYRTGDLGRVLPDGELGFHGRTDGQVKIRGYRVEPAEIERALEAHPDVRQAVVLVKESPAADPRLYAFVTLSGAGGVADLRAFLAGRLPRYLIPHGLVPVDAFPLTSNGKVDRVALADLGATGPGGYVPARTPGEQLIAKVWAMALGLPQVGKSDEFFALGGDSLAAGKVAARLGELLGVDVPLPVFFTGGLTVESLAAAVESGEFAPRASLASRIPRRVREGGPQNP